MAVFFYGLLPRPPFSRRAYSTRKRERTVAMATVRHLARNVSSFHCQFPARSVIGRGLPALAPALDYTTVRAEGGFLQRSFLLPRCSGISKLRSLAFCSARFRSPFLLFLPLSSVVSLRLSFTRGEGRGRFRVELSLFYSLGAAGRDSAPSFFFSPALPAAPPDCVPRAALPASR